jgi:peptidoglycan/LPS O-acetylase OafA/YrhL
MQTTTATTDTYDRISLLMGVVAVALVIASLVHLLGDVHGRADLFDPNAAGVAEAVLAAVLGAGAAAMRRQPRRARTIGLTALGVTTAGFVLGASITVRAGHLPDIAFHLATLPVLVGAMVALARANPAR